MGFLDFWREQPKDEQGSLLPDVVESKPVIDSTQTTRKLAQKRLQEEVQKRGGTKKTHRRINTIISQEMLGHEPQELYQALEIKRSRQNRDALPTDAQEALYTGDIAARHAIVEDDAQGHDSLIKSGRRGCSRAKGIFSWNR